MKLSEAEVRALQALARGPAGLSGSPLEGAAETLATVFPGASLAEVEWTGDAAPGAALDPRTLEEPPPGPCYLVHGPDPAGRATALCLPASADALAPRQLRLLRRIAPWLAAWIAPRPPSPEPPPVGSALWVDAAGEVLHADDAADGLLHGAGDLRAQLAALYRDAAERLRAERVLEVPGRGLLRLRAEAPTDAGCLIALELLAPGSEAMLRAQAQELTARELQVARLVLQGWGNRGIAEQLGLASPTINMYLGRIYAKLGVKNRTELARHLSGAASA